MKGWFFQPSFFCAEKKSRKSSAASGEMLLCLGEEGSVVFSVASMGLSGEGLLTGWGCSGVLRKGDGIGFWEYMAASIAFLSLYIMFPKVFS